MKQITTTTARTARPTTPTYRLTDADYVEMIDEIIDSIASRNYGIFIDGKAYWFELDYITGEDCELVIRLSGEVVMSRDYYRGGSDGPGYDERTGRISLKSHDCRQLIEGVAFDGMPKAECDFDPRRIDNYDYELSSCEIDFNNDFDD